MLEDTSSYCSLLTNYFHSTLAEQITWVKTKYIHNTAHPERLIHKTLPNIMVRSKSEELIANSLYINRIPFRYECALQLDDLVFFPDFTILHPKTNKLIYWEHFGMMDNPTYCEKSFRKLNCYGLHGIIPTLNLICTYETSNHPIDSAQILQIIEQYFL